MAVEKYMSNIKRDRHTREDNSNNINIKEPTCLWSASVVLLLLSNMYLFVRWIIYNLLNKRRKKRKQKERKKETLRHKLNHSTKIGATCQINPRFGGNTLHNLQGNYLHIPCFTSLLKRSVVFLCLISSSKSVYSWGAR